MINPRVDIEFKKIFGVEQNKDLLIPLLNSIISEEDQVAYVEILNPYNLQDFKNDKLSIVDIKAKNKLTGAYFLIEMQIADELHYHKRGLYGWAKFYGSQLVKSEDYDKLVKTIAIHILNSPSSITKNMTVGGFIRQINPREINDPKIKKALEVMQEMDMTRVERDLYEGHLNFVRLEGEVFKKRFLDGEAKGLAEGKLKGKKNKSIEIAKKILTKGQDPELVAEITSLTLDEISKI